MNCDLGSTTVLSASRCTHTWPDPVLVHSFSLSLFPTNANFWNAYPLQTLEKMIVDNDKLLEALEATRMAEDQNIDVRFA